MKKIVLPLILIICASGCAMTDSASKEEIEGRGYFSNLGQEFVDIFEFGVLAGPGIRVDAKYGLGFVAARATLR